MPAKRGKNVLGSDLEDCSLDPLTGFYRDGCCRTGSEDLGMHTVCIQATEDFLAFSKAVGNDLSTPSENHSFPGLKEGDHWCLCAKRWQEAFDAGFAPKVNLKATHISVLEYVDLAVLKQFSIHAEETEE